MCVSQNSNGFFYFYSAFLFQSSKIYKERFGNYVFEKKKKFFGDLKGLDRISVLKLIYVN